MRVKEKESDRQAEVHVHAQGQVKELEEFGQYLDTTDNALCCYVPVEEGQVLKVAGKFHGTTLTVAFDVAIDGVYRKANSFVGKSVRHRKSERLEFNSFLFQTKEGILDTEVKVSKLIDVTTTQNDGPETVGTIEMRVFVVRSFGVEHQIGDIQTYYKQEADAEDEGEDSPTVTYRTIAPDFKMEFERNCAALDRNAASRQKKKVDAKRPGKAPWAIFRFHYRSRESIEKEMELTHNPKSKGSSQTHEFELEPVPTLQVGSKPAKADDAENSTRASSPPPTVPSTPAKSVQTPLSPTVKKQPPRFSTPTPAPADKDPHAVPDRSPSPNLQRSTEEDAGEWSEKTTKKEQAAGVADTTASESTVYGEGSEKIQEKPAVSGDGDAPKPEDHAQHSIEDQALKVSSPDKDHAERAEDDDHTTAPQATRGAQNPTKPAAISEKKAYEAPKPKPSAAVPVSISLAKRPSQAKLPTSPELKRAKLAPLVGLASRASSASSTASQDPKTPSLAEKRKQLKILRLKREQAAKQRAKIDEQLVPFKRQVEEEMARVNKELENEQRALAEEMQQLRDDAAMLAEFKSAENGD